MILVYSHKITPRLTYIFRQIFIRILELPVDFTSTIEKFVSHSGPKLSYTHQPLGKEFFIRSHDLLFQQGIQEVPIEVLNWSGIPAFFKLGKPSQLPYDIFAASFYLMSRYEEYLPHVKDELGRFSSDQCLAVQNNFLELPVIDLWAKNFYEFFIKKFPELKTNKTPSNSLIPLIDVVSPYKYKHKSFLRNLAQVFLNISKFKLWIILEHIMVLLGFWKDPWNNFDDFLGFFKKAKLKPRFFFLFSKISYYDQGISVFNSHFHSLIKYVADYHKSSLLVSTEARQKARSFKTEIERFEKIIHRNTKFLRFNTGVTSVFDTYRNVLGMEEMADFSLGYHDKIGYRASTAVPFRFYDLENEVETALVLYAVVATEDALRKLDAHSAFQKLKQLQNQIPTPTGVHVFSVSNAIFSPNNNNKSWKQAYKNYILSHD